MSILKQIVKKWFRVDDAPCESCETLRMQLDIVNHEKKQMLETIIGFTRPAEEIKIAEPRVINPILPKAKTWRMRQAELEKNDRLTAERLKNKREEDEQLKSIENLEKETGIDEELKDASA